MRVIEWCLQTDMSKRPSAGQLVGIPRVSNILKTIKLKNMNAQTQKLNEKNEQLQAEIMQKKAIFARLEEEVNLRKQKQQQVDEKIQTLKKLKEEFEREIARTSHKSSHNDLLSTDDMSYESDKLIWNNNII